MNKIFKLIISMVLPLLVGFTASLLTRPQITGWFTTIEKPSWQPPNNWFGPVWTVLYILMGIAFYLIWKADAPAKDKRMAILCWSVQLLLNFGWSLLFFDQHLIGLALIEIILLWMAIIFTIFSFARISKIASWLLVPYLSWVSFAALLNAAIWQLNK